MEYTDIRKQLRHVVSVQSTLLRGNMAVKGYILLNTLWRSMGVLWNVKV